MGRATDFNKLLGWIIMSTVIYSLLVIIILHFLQPEKDPTVNAISEYVDGNSGGLMTTVFFIQAIGSIAIGILAVRMRPKHRKLLIGGLLFVLAALGDVIAGLYPADPIATETMTSEGMIHAAGGMLRFVSLAIGLPLLSSGFKKNEYWQEHGGALKILAILFIVIFLVTILVLTQVGLFGIGQRGFIVLVLLWMFIVARPLTQLK